MFLETFGTTTNHRILPTQSLSSFWWTVELTFSGFGQPCPELALLSICPAANFHPGCDNA